MANGKTILPPVKDYYRGHLIPEFPDSENINVPEELRPS